MPVYKREVEKGDTLYGIVELAKDYFASIGETIKGALSWTKVAEENGIDTNTGKIKPGDEVTVNSSWASASAEPKNLSTTAKIDFFGLQAGTDRTLFATWKWDKEETDKYEVRWYYDTGNNGIWFIGEDTTADHKQSTYSAPENAIRARVVVRPVAKTKTVNKKEVAYWVANWSTERIYSFSDNPPSVPPVPSVEIKDYTLTATLDNLHELNATHIRFEVFQDNGKLFSSGTAKIITYHASFSCTVTAGHEYKVCCRSVRGSELSDWTQFSENITTKPAASTGITTCKATSETSVYLEWAEVANATAYEIEYATKKEYFDNSSQVTPQGDIKYPHYEVSGLESGSEYFFRVRATNEKGESAWTEIKSVVIGTTPTAPTTWSSTSTCIVGEPLTLYWLHNTEDNSAQTYAEVELYIDGLKETHTINTT
ncbi:fibronectin type III domain-containing protein, partial [Fibrobacter sp.]|uniref:fibronectin type III domain-containing protein n=1 Tax=Fibrobacter sp. TaxID=35828 RepID=UPI00388D03BB